MDSYLFSNIGNRDVNEDCVTFAEKENESIYVLCDGLGGHGMGDYASKLVCDTFVNTFGADDKNQDLLEESFLAAQNSLIIKQNEIHAQKKMKTTCVAVHVLNDAVRIGHVGDSRCYIFAHGKVLKRTIDHSIPQMMVIAGDIKESEIRHHPQRNIVLKVMGNEWEEPQYDIMEWMPLKKCDAILLCTDGFWELIEEKEMCETLKKAHSAEEWIQQMAEIVQQNGKECDMDNNSAIGIINENRKRGFLW